MIFVLLDNVNEEEEGGGKKNARRVNDLTGLFSEGGRQMENE